MDAPDTDLGEHGEAIFSAIEQQAGLEPGFAAQRGPIREKIRGFLKNHHDGALLKEIGTVVPGPAGPILEIIGTVLGKLPTKPTQDQAMGQ